MIKTVKYVEVARGDKLADLVLKNCQIVNVFSNELEKGDIAITDGVIVGIGSYNGKKEYQNRSTKLIMKKRLVGKQNMSVITMM
ncbi:MAG: hypothetical protein ACVCEJ_03430 [Candidatus Izemoplasmataceae bacterium]